MPMPIPCPFGSPATSPEGKPGNLCALTSVPDNPSPLVILDDGCRHCVTHFPGRSPEHPGKVVGSYLYRATKSDHWLRVATESVTLRPTAKDIIAQAGRGRCDHLGRTPVSRAGCNCWKKDGYRCGLSLGSDGVAVPERDCETCPEWTPEDADMTEATPATISAPPPAIGDVVINADAHGFGDAVTTAWIAAGVNYDLPAGAAPRVSFHATGGKADLLRILGQHVDDSPAARARSTTTFDSYNNHEVPRGRNHVRVIDRGRALGITAPPRRPLATIPQADLDAAVEFAAARREADQSESLVLLFPRSVYRSREWHPGYWIDLAWGLRSCGHSVVVVTDVEDPRFAGAPYRLWGQSVARMMALMLEADVVVGIDSAPALIAGTLGVPTVAIMGPTTAAAIYHGMPSVSAIEPARELAPCAGCWFGHPFRAACDQGCPAMLEVRPPQVIRHVHNLVHADGMARDRGWWIRPQFGGGRHDWDVINEVWTHDCYRLGRLGIEPGQHELVVDVGAHIGTFGRAYAARNPAARIVAVEAAPENIPTLERNVGWHATVVHAACTYTPGDQPLVLANSLRPAGDGTATGGSTLVSADSPLHTFGHLYWRDERPLPRVTLEDIVAVHGRGRDWIDVLKLDCEGSEWSILAGSRLVRERRVGIILGEYHGRAAFDAACGDGGPLAGWQVEVMHATADGLGLFRARPLASA